MLRRVRVWARAWVRGRVVEREMQNEMQMHLERAAERLMARGLSPEEARAAARREFGNLGVIQEHARDARGVRWIEELVRDTRYAARGLRRTPGFAIAVAPADQRRSSPRPRKSAPDHSRHGAAGQACGSRERPRAPRVEQSTARAEKDRPSFRSSRR